MTITSISALPLTVNNPAIKADMRVIDYVVTNGACMLTEWHASTAAGMITITGNLLSTTDLILFLESSEAI